MSDRHNAAVEYHRAMLRVLAAVGDLERAFEAWGNAAHALETTGATADDAAQHAVIDETRAAFGRIAERFPAAIQMMGLERLAALLTPPQESLS
jgi:hypothetical protein